jgi:ADP-ribose pyrophosphatase
MKLPKLLHATRWLSLFELDGWVYVSRRPPGQAPRIDAVNVIALHEEGERRRLVVIEEWRVPVQSWEFALPAGLVDPGEEPIVSAERELIEETGFTVTWRGASSGRLFSSAGMSDESFAFAFLGCTGKAADKPGVGAEQIKVHLLDRAGCRDLLKRNREGAPLSGRLWTVLHSIAETGAIGPHVVA